MLYQVVTAIRGRILRPFATYGQAKAIVDELNTQSLSAWVEGVIA